MAIATSGGEVLYKSTDPVAESLYVNYERLEAASEADRPTLTGAYEELLKAATSSARTKNLATQMIPQFFRYFSEDASLMDKAMNKFFDLVEDESPHIRMGAIQRLPELCADVPSQAGKIADVLGQLLLSDSEEELSTVKEALTTVFRKHMATTVETLVAQASDAGADEMLRDRVAAFLGSKMPGAARDAAKQDEDAQNRIMTVLTTALRDCPDELFAPLAKGFRLLPQFVSKGAEGKAEYMKALAEIGNSDGLDIADEVATMKFLRAFREALPAILRGAPPGPFWETAVHHLLSEEGFGALSDQNALKLLEILTGVVPHLDREQSAAALPVVYRMLKVRLPQEKPPAAAADDAAAESEAKPKAVAPSFSILECLLHMFHVLGRKHLDDLPALCGLDCKEREKVFTGQPSEFFGNRRVNAEERDAIVAALGRLRRWTAVYKTRVASALAQVKAALASALDAPAPGAGAGAKGSSSSSASPMQQRHRDIDRNKRAIENADRLAEMLVKSQPQVLGAIAGTKFPLSFLRGRQQQQEKQQKKKGQQQQGKGKDQKKGGNAAKGGGAKQPLARPASGAQGGRNRRRGNRGNNGAAAGGGAGAGKGGGAGAGAGAGDGGRSRGRKRRASEVTVVLPNKARAASRGGGAPGNKRQRRR